MIARGHKLAEQGLTHSLKKAPGSKKRKKNAAVENTADAPSSTVETASSVPASNSRSNTSTPTPGASGNRIKNASTATLTSRVLQEQEEKKKRRKLAGNDNLDSLFSKEKDGAKKSGDFMTRGFSIPTAARR